MREVNFVIGGRDYIRGCDILSAGPWGANQEVKVSFRGFCAEPGSWIYSSGLKCGDIIFVDAKSVDTGEKWVFVRHNGKLLTLDERDESEYIKSSVLFGDEIKSHVLSTANFWEQVVAMTRLITDHKFRGSKQIVASARFKGVKEILPGCEVLLGLRKIKGRSLQYKIYIDKCDWGDLLIVAL